MVQYYRTGYDASSGALSDATRHCVLVQLGRADASITDLAERFRMTPAWTKPDLLKRWCAPKSFGPSFLACEADVRTGGKYRFVSGRAASEQSMEFFGRCVEVTPHSRLQLDELLATLGAVGRL